MSKANPVYDHWRPPQPQRIVFGALGVGKTYIGHSKQKETTDKEDEGSE